MKMEEAFLKLRTPSPTLLTDSNISHFRKSHLDKMFKWIEIMTVTHLVVKLIIQLAKVKIRQVSDKLNILRFAIKAVLDYVALVVLHEALRAGKKRNAERRREKSGMHEQGIVNPRKRSKSAPADNAAWVGSAVINVWISETAVLAWPMRLWSSGSRLRPSEAIALTGPSGVGSGW